MKTQQRSFVVEIKSARRRLKTQPKSIWGDTDFKALVRDAEATLPFMENAVSDAPVSLVDRPLEPQTQGDVTDSHEAGADVLIRLPSSGPDAVQPHLQDQVSKENTAADRPKPKIARPLERSQISPAQKAEDIKPASAAAAVDDVEIHIDELALLDAENLRLKRLLAEHLRQQNAELMMMLKRFERA